MQHDATHEHWRVRASAGRRSAPFIVLGGVVLAGVGVAALRAAGVDALPACPWHALTGLDCPGCGSTRAGMALLRGDVGTALSHNVVFVLGVLPLLVAGWIAWARAAVRERPLSFSLSPRAVPILVVALLAFAVVRNLPGVPFLDAAA
jgi:hypothetical protein